jgi:tetratricopeptide (TPR) repeat protein
VKRGALGALVCLLAIACQKGGSEAPAAAGGSLAEARTLVEGGQLDEALARLQSNTEPEALYLQGVAWARKAEKAPIPTPVPGATALPEWKPEEIRAIDFFERATEARPDLAGAHLALAQILAPHALARAERDASASAAAARRRKGKAPEPLPAVAAEGPDASPERVVREYQRAAQGDPASKAPVEALIDFAARAGRIADAESGYLELLKRVRERPEPFVAYGDFLRDKKQDTDGAIAQYRQALIWRPDDDETRGKIADIYIAQARAHVDAREYATADARLHEAEKYVTDKSSPVGQRLQEQQTFLAQIRGRSPGR